ncbi:hypothetical protein Tco_1086007 [Tanacetum coccineum]
MGDENPILTLGDYSKPSHEGYKNNIELPIGNNVVPLRSDTIRLVQNGCSFHGLRPEDPNQHLKDFLKVVDSLDLDGSITTWEDLTNRFLAQFFPPGRAAKLHNDILIRTINQSGGGKLRDRNAEESWALLEDLALYDNEIWNDPTDFAKPVKAIALPQDVPSTSDRCLIELKNQVQRLMETHLALTQPTQVNKVTTSCEIYNGPHDTQYCMEDPEQAFIEYLSSRNHDIGNRKFTTNQGPNDFDFHQEKRLSSLRTQLGQQQDDMIRKINLLWKTVSEKLIDASILESARNSLASKNIASICHIERGGSEERELKAHQSYSPQKGETTTDITPEHSHNITKEVKGEVKEVIDEEESEVETDEEVKEILKDEEGDEDDTTSIIDRHLGEMAFGRPFIDEIGLVYNKEEGTVMFKQDDEKITFKMPHTMEIFKQTRLMGLSTDSIPSSAHEENFGHERTHYYQSLLIGDEYMNGYIRNHKKTVKNGQARTRESEEYKKKPKNQSRSRKSQTLSQNGQIMVIFDEKKLESS